MRLKQNRKSLDLAPSAESELPLAAKKFRTESVLNSGEALPEAEFVSKQEQLKAEWEGNRRHPVMKLLLASMRVNMRQWIQTTPQVSMAMVLEKFPCLQEGNHVSIFLGFTL